MRLDFVPMKLRLWMVEWLFWNGVDDDERNAEEEKDAADAVDMETDRLINCSGIEKEKDLLDCRLL